MKCKNKLLALLCCAFLLVGECLPVLADETSEKEEENVTEVSQEADGIMGLDSIKPADYDEFSEIHVFNTDKNEPFMAVEENELMVYYSDGSGAKKYGYNLFQEVNESTAALSGEVCNIGDLGLSYVSGVGLDGDGDAREEYIAYLGVNTRGNFIIKFVNAETGQIQEFTIGKYDWVKEVEQWSYKNYLSIAAGDFNGDGVDDIVYTCGSTDITVSFLKYSKSNGISIMENATYSLEDLLDTSKVDISMFKSGDNIEERPVFGLAVGNFDEDKAEEFAVSISSNDVDPDDDIPIATITMNVAVVDDTQNGGNVEKYQLYTKEQITNDQQIGKNIYRTLYAGQIAAGDVDGDLIDEIVAVGYTGVVTDKDGILSDKYVIEESNIGMCYLDRYKDKFIVSQITPHAMNKFIDEGFWESNDEWCTLSVATARLNGPYAPEQVFVGGKIYDLSSGIPTEVYNYSYFNNKSYEGSDAYIEHIAVGNFDYNKSAKEQIVFSIALKESWYDNYSYQLGYIAKEDNYIDNSSVNKGGNAKWVSRGFGNFNEEDSKGHGTNMVPVSLDCDDDGLKVRYVSSRYMYKDPAVVAVLQAAPYFEALGDWETFQGSTTYSITTSKTVMDISGMNINVGAGIKTVGEVSIGASFDVEMQMGYSMATNLLYYNAYRTTYTSTFEAGAYDTVVLERVPFICYEYEIFDEGTQKWLEDVHFEMYSDLHPVYFQLSIPDYNEFVSKYNKMVDEVEIADYTNEKKVYLKPIDENVMPIDATGHPEKYDNKVNDGQIVSKGTYALSSNGGAITSEWSEEYEKVREATYAHGGSFTGAALAGFGLLGNNAKTGLYVEFCMQDIYGNGDASIDGSGTSGTVTNIDGNYFIGMGMDSTTIRKYGFNWRNAMWEKPLMVDNTGKEYYTPVMGYVVTNVTQPNSAPEQFEAELSKDKSTTILTWQMNEKTDMDGDGTKDEELCGYVIYRSCDGKTPEVIAEITDPEAARYVDMGENLKPGKLYTYYISAKYKELETAIVYTTVPTSGNSVIWGVTGVDGKGIEKVELTKTEGLKDFYTIYYTDGTTQDYTITNGADGVKGEVGERGEQGKQGEKGEQGEQGEQGENGNGIAGITLIGSEGLTDTYEIRFTDGTTSTFTVTNGNGITQIQLDENGQLVITMSDGTVYNLGLTQSSGMAGVTGTALASGMNLAVVASIISMVTSVSCLVVVLKKMGIKK